MPIDLTPIETAIQTYCDTGDLRRRLADTDLWQSPEDLTDVVRELLTDVSLLLQYYQLPTTLPALAAQAQDWAAAEYARTEEPR